MLQNLTEKEIKWRFETLNSEIEPDFNENPIEIDEQDKELSHRLEYLMVGTLVYLSKAGCIKIVLHEDPIEDAVFTTSRIEMQMNAWTEPSEMHQYDRPSEREIPIPDIFVEEEKEDCSWVSLLFEYPDNQLGRFCKRMIKYLRNCKGTEDVHIINAVVFMHYYVNDTSVYHSCMHNALLFAMVIDHWTSAYQHPDEIQDLLGYLINESRESIYDPFMRTGCNMYLTLGEYSAQASNPYHFYATMLFAGLWDLDPDMIKLEDCTQNWNPGDCKCIIATPDFNLQVTHEDKTVEPVGSWLLEKMLSCMSVKDRQAIMILPSSVLSASGKYERLRHDIIQANILDTIVLLPANIFPLTGISTAIILLSQDRDEDTPITLVDLTSALKMENEWEDTSKAELDGDRVKSIFKKQDARYFLNISPSEIKIHGYDWYVPKYIKKEFDIPQGYTKVTIGSLLEFISYYEIGCGINNDVLGLEEMSSSPFGDDLALEHVDMSDFKDDYDEEDYDFLSSSCFVISYSEDGLHTYYHEQQQISMTHLAVPKAFDCYRVNPEVINIDYLRLLLHDIYPTLGKAQSRGGQRLTLRNQEVVIPISVDEQKRLYEEAKLNHAIEKARKEGLDEAIDRMKQEYMTEVRMRKHDMKPFLSQLDSQAKLIAFYLDKIDGNEETVAKIREKLTGVSNAVSELRLHLNRLTEEDIYGTPEVLNPISILKELTGTFSNYAVSLEVDEIAFKEAGIKEPQIFISPVDFSTLVSTIIENAVAHAFVGDASDYRVLINFSYNQEKQMYTIDFWNNGNPMPEGMDKFRYGLKGEKGARSKGTGLGGYRVKSITRHYGGDYDVFISRTKNSTTIRVLFPKYMKDEEV